MKTKFRDIRLSKSNRERLILINNIVREYQDQGYKLTLRQLYYQLVSRDVVPNKVAEYGKLSNLLKEGRMAGIVDWNAIEDRLRRPSKPSSWENPASIMDSVIDSYELPRMQGQPNYVETWVEKDALSGVLSRVTEQYHIPILVNRGYSSVSAMYDSYLRFKRALMNNQAVTILYLGDYDPSGIDMIRDIEDRIVEFFRGCEELKSFYRQKELDQYDRDYEPPENELVVNENELEAFYSEDESMYEDGEFVPYFAFIKHHFTVLPIALTLEQINAYNPPPNPAKVTDPRAKKFMAELGTTSWEVDALRPQVLNQILTDAIEDRLTLSLYEAQLEKEKVDIERLEKLKEQLTD